MAFFKKIKQLFSKKKSLENKKDGFKSSNVLMKTNKIVPEIFNQNSLLTRARTEARIEAEPELEQEQPEQN